MCPEDSMKQQLHEMLEAMHMQNSSLFEDGFGQLHESLGMNILNTGWEKNMKGKGKIVGTPMFV